MELLKTFNPDNLITFTESASEHLITSIESSEGAVGVSLALKPAGCAGFEFVWKIVTDIEEGFSEQVLGDYLFLLDNMSKDFLAGSIVDLVNEGLKGKTLTVRSPKASGECGCGESVTFDV
tara:strand:+ start:4601 stop:4963 length:363 start_codon:yes stop_codon:yes gene_type:complete